MEIVNDTVVTIHYELRDRDQVLLDKSEANAPLTFMHGVGAMVHGLEKALLGKVAGDSFSVVLMPEDAYGERDESLLQQVPRDAFEDIEQVEVGMQFQTTNEDGSQGPLITVIEFIDEDVVIDANHPLAGIEMHFEIEVVSVRAATQEELHRGHAHTP